MNDIAELERRITAALERIGLGLDHLGGAMPVAADDSAEVERLTAALEDERSANAQLTERVKAIREKQEGVVGALERRVEDLSGQLDGAVEELKRLKEANAELAEANRALAEASDEGVMEPHLINRSMRIELEALRAARAAEIAEMDEILSELRPLIGEVA
ncbi:MAG: hypothetical protein KDE00_05215 [Rhodobacteraceae bacterium]|nr:hypothetical protein [Paracoccaceae bacterium]